MRNTSVILSIFIITVVAANNSFAAKDYEILFKDYGSNLPEKDKISIFEILEIEYSFKEGTFVDIFCKKKVYPKIKIIDLNNDGRNEIFVNWGNTCISGMSGSSVLLFTRNGSNELTKNFGFPGIHKILKSNNQGYPDILIGGPGFCHGVWGWSSNKYRYKCSKEESKGACARKDVKSICD